MNVMSRSVYYAIKHGSQAMAVTSPSKPSSHGAIVVTASVAAVMGSYSDLVYCEFHFACRVTILELRLIPLQQEPKAQLVDSSVPEL